MAESVDRASAPAGLLGAKSGRVKVVRELARRRVRDRRGLFLAEGWKALEAARERDLVEEVFATPAGAAEHAALLTGLRVHLVDERAMSALADAVTPQGLVAVCRHVDVPVAELLAEPRVGSPGHQLVICADVRDPGNAGTVIRTADAAGARGVLLAGDSVDVHNPKTVRATVGSLFHLPVARVADPGEAVALARAAGYLVLAADGAGEISLFDAGDLLARPVAWLFGNEAWGLPESLAAEADHRVAIPILGRAESLNLATAVAVCLYATASAQAR